MKPRPDDGDDFDLLAAATGKSKAAMKPRPDDGDDAPQDETPQDAPDPPQ